MIISVIIPCYNMERTVGDAIRSVQMQTFRNWRLIVVDDARAWHSYIIKSNMYRERAAWYARKAFYDETGD